MTAALHGLTMNGAYPIFTDVAVATGRRLTLQGSVTLSPLFAGKRWVG